MDKKVLVVDDEINQLQLLNSFLSDEGYSVYTADSGKGALDTLKKESIFIIYSDLQMPAMNGIELCKKIREVNQLAWVCAITGARSLFEIAECREAGFDDYFLKPLDLALILKNTQDAFLRLERWKGK